MQTNLQITFWKNGRGEPRYYWGGADPDAGLGVDVCGCRMDDSCAAPPDATAASRCNCDVNDQAWRRDEGFLTKKEDLPVSMILAGDTGEG